MWILLNRQMVHDGICSRWKATFSNPLALHCVTARISVTAESQSKQYSLLSTSQLCVCMESKSTPFQCKQINSREKRWGGEKRYNENVRQKASRKCHMIKAWVDKKLAGWKTVWCSLQLRFDPKQTNMLALTNTFNAA